MFAPDVHEPTPVINQMINGEITTMECNAVYLQYTENDIAVVQESKKPESRLLLNSFGTNQIRLRTECCQHKNVQDTLAKIDALRPQQNIRNGTRHYYFKIDTTAGEYQIADHELETFAVAIDELVGPYFY